MDRNNELADLYRELAPQAVIDHLRKRTLEKKVEGDWYLFEKYEFYFVDMVVDDFLVTNQSSLSWMKELGWKVTKVSIYREE